MGQPVLSIGIIVKNEIRCIERCLNALQPLREALPCELVIADTGSTDGTREICEKYADILFDFPWIKDFSAARNAVMSRCSGKWFLSVDADETLHSDVQEMVDFFSNPISDMVHLAVITIRNFERLDMQGDYHDFGAMRMARLDGDIHYEGAIHEQLKWSGVKGKYFFEHIIFDHDGYVVDAPQMRKEKHARNMELIKQKLEQNPLDLPTWTQYLESSEQGSTERHEGTITAMHHIQDYPEAPFWDECAQMIIQYAITWACQENWPEMKEWRQWVEDRPDLLRFMSVRLDAANYMAESYFKEKNYEQALKWAEIYLNSYAEMQSYSQTEIMKLCQISVMYTMTDFCYRRGVVMQAGSLANLGRMDEALPVMKSYWGKFPNAEPACRILEVSVLAPEHQEVQAFFATVVQSCMDDPENQDNKHYGELMNKLYALFTEAPKWRLACQLDHEVGIAARIMDQYTATDIASSMSLVQNWEKVPYQAMHHIIELNLPFADSFYMQSMETTQSWASTLVQYGDASGIDRIYRWSETLTRDSDIRKIQFSFHLLISICRKINWGENEYIPEDLATCLLETGQRFLPMYYASALLSDENNWNLMPSMYVYILHLLHGKSALEQGDELTWTARLRKALEVAPAMKNMVQYLMEYPPVMTVNRELMELAAQVQKILSMYSPNDPAVLALKASPVYQRAEHLIEPKRKVYLMQKEEPTTELKNQFQKLISQCTFHSQKQANNAVRNAFSRLHHADQKRLEKYWNMYPLWGHGIKEVLEGSAVSIHEHLQDYEWLFHRLQDNQSRLVLLAILRSWRMFDFALLNNVIERKYTTYFDRDILHCDQNEVIVDLGAYIGDTFCDYVKNYGRQFKRYYAYEITPESMDKVKQVSAGFNNVVYRQKAVGDKPGIMYMNLHSDASSNGISQSGDVEVEVVSIDQDVQEAITLIKMDIEGAEESALWGCKRHIQEDHPKLALSVYHNFKDLWKLPKMVEEFTSGYQFYLRYNGGNGWPTEITFIAIPTV